MAKSKTGGNSATVPTFNQADGLSDKDWKALDADQQRTLAESNFAALGLTDLQSELQTIPIAECYHEINQREQAQLDANAARLADSMRRRGFDPSKPIVVSAKSKGRFLILQGHSRHLAAGIVGIDNVPAVVYTGLTPAQERIIVADDTKDAESLGKSDWAQFLEIAEIVAAGYTSETALAIHFGWTHKNKNGQPEPARNKMQLRVNGAKMAKRIPKFRAALQNGLSDVVDTSKPCVKWADVQQLRKADNADTANGVTDGSGPAFAEAWAKVIAKYSPSGDKSTKASLTPTAAKSKMETLSSRIMRDALMVATGQGETGVTLQTLDARAVAAESALELVSALETNFGEEFAALCARLPQPETETEPAAVA